MSKGKFYITTPIYYPSDKLHIGHTYCTVATDAIARYKRLCGYDVMFLTGTDEHGQKIEEKAEAAGVTPKQFVDNIVEGPGGVRALWKLMNISNDRFIRTTDDYHVEAVQRIFKKMYDKGDIYKGKYSGMYCTPCESFWTESQLVDGKCPDCGREVHYAEEEAYFFRLSKYAEPVRELLRGLQSRAARLAENRLRQALLLAANQLREYLRMRRDAAGLTVPESARQIELLEERSRLLAGPLEEQARKLEQQAGDWERSLAARLAGTVERAAPSMEAMLLCEQNPASYVDDTLRAAALDSLRRELEPALRGYQKSVNALLRLQGVASGPDAAARCAVSPSWGVLAGFPGSDGLFAEILALLRGVPRGRRRESLRVMLPVRVLPKLSERALAFTAQEGGTALEAVRQAAGKAVREQSLLRRAALEELERRGEPNAAEQTRLLREIRAQAQAADAALSACCRKDEEDAYGTDL